MARWRCAFFYSLRSWSLRSMFYVATLHDVASLLGRFAPLSLRDLCVPLAFWCTYSHFDSLSISVS
jgi:hypothetical protein